ncbi:50S ribosomal protein L11 methyltransferase [Methylobacterium sp. A54F]
MDLNAIIAQRVKAMAAEGALDTPAGLNRCLRLLAIWRSKLIDREIIARHGLTIQNGPFAGMRFRSEAAEGCLAAKLLGSYEEPLHGFLMEVAGSAYEAIIDVGCAEGYYAVGLARRTTTTRVYAYDTNPAAQEACRELAALNGVADRIEVGGEFQGERFAEFADRRTLVVVDIEGAEDALLRPDLYPALARMTILVECHDVFAPGLCEAIAGRFRASHAVRRIDGQPAPPALPEWFEATNHLDQLLAGWEWRSGPTPWLVMRPRPSA